MMELEEKLQNTRLFTQEEIDKVVETTADKALQDVLTKMPDNLRKAYQKTQEEKSQANQQSINKNSPSGLRRT